MSFTGDAGSGSVLAHGPALEQREASLGSDLHSASEARRLMRRFLEDIGRHAWRDTAELAISEVVTNASLHAHTPIEIRLSGYVDQVFVEVATSTAHFPCSGTTTSKRRLAGGCPLLRPSRSNAGCIRLGDGGKVVCSASGDPPAASDDNILLKWDVEAWPEPLAASSETRRVVLASMPSAPSTTTPSSGSSSCNCAEHGAPKTDLAAVDKARSTISNALINALDEANASGTARPVLPEGHHSPLPWVPDHLDLHIQVPADAAWQYADKVLCRFMAERAPVNPGRSVYMAWIEPLEPHDG